MVTSRTALEGLLQNRLTATADVRCKDALRMQGNATELFHHLYAGKHHHADDTSSSSCGVDETTMRTVLQTIKREAHTPTTDQSEDSGVDVAAGDGRGPFGRKRAQDDSDDGDGCPTAVKCGRTAVAGALRSTDACPPFRPWSGGGDDESSSEVGLRLFRDIRDVDRIMTLTQRRRGEQCPPPPPPPPPPTQEPQPLDLTKGVRWGPGDSTPPPPPAEEEEGFPGASVNGAVTCAAPSCSTRYGKNMSRARRIEANARERSRVHTISAAFDTLRATVPSYSRNQKLSKLSTIRIASAYILTLSRLLDMDYSAEQDSPSVAECVDNVTGIIHMEGKAKKRKDEH